MDVLVSVVIPVYNMENYLDRCVNSVVNQSYKNLEIILVDDGSKDKSPAMCDAWAEKDNRIVVVHKENAGLGMARNSGMEIARGDYIIFPDSDDYIHENLVEKCVKVATENDAEVVVFSCFEVDETGNEKARQISSASDVYEGECVQKELLAGMFSYSMGIGVSAWSKMYKRDVLRKNGLQFVSERQIISEDSYFMLEFFSKVSKAFVLKENLYYYCKRENSLSRAFKEDRIEKNNEFLRQSLEYIDTNGIHSEVAVHLESRYHGLMLGAMVKLMQSDLSKGEKKRILKELFADKLLQSTMCDNVISHDAKISGIFWKAFRKKQFWLCYVFLKYKSIK